MTIHFTVTFEESSYTAIESDKFVTVCLQRLDLIAKSIVVNLTTFDNISVGKFLLCGYTSYTMSMGAIYRYIPKLMEGHTVTTRVMTDTWQGSNLKPRCMGKPSYYSEITWLSNIPLLLLIHKTLNYILIMPYIILFLAGEDYEALQSYSLTLGGAGSRCANITIISDNRVEGPENFAVRADSTDGSAFTTVVIIDSSKYD